MDYYRFIELVCASFFSSKRCSSLCLSKVETSHRKNLVGDLSIRLQRSKKRLRARHTSYELGKCIRMHGPSTITQLRSKSKGFSFFFTKAFPNTIYFRMFILSINIFGKAPIEYTLRHTIRRSQESNGCIQLL